MLAASQRLHEIARSHQQIVSAHVHANRHLRRSLFVARRTAAIALARAEEAEGQFQELLSQIAAQDLELEDLREEVMDLASAPILDEAARDAIRHHEEEGLTTLRQQHEQALSDIRQQHALEIQELHRRHEHELTTLRTEATAAEDDLAELQRLLDSSRRRSLGRLPSSTTTSAAGPGVEASSALPSATP